MQEPSHKRVLPYCLQIIQDMLEQDGLLILAKGLGLHQILLAFLKLYCEPTNLVFFLNAHSEEQEQYVAELKAEGVKCTPHIISADISASERTEVYLQGGVVFVSARVLVVDLLNKRVPTHLVSGFLIPNAHRVSETSSEAFILRLFRQVNKTGFIKAFSESPESFLGFNKVEKIMRYLFVTKLYLWPRFHAVVADSLETHQPEVIELHQPLTPTMQSLQTAIVEVMEACLQELRETNLLDTADLTLENGLFKSFDVIIKRQLESVWHKTGPKTKQLVADLRTLRSLLVYLVSHDCVTYNRFLETLGGHVFGEYSGWLFMDAAKRIFQIAKNRVFITRTISKKPKKKQKPDPQDHETGAVQTDTGPQYELILEENPKWALLKEILDEIEKENAIGFGESVLIAAADDRTCTQLADYLRLGGRAMMFSIFQSDFGKKVFYSATMNSGVISASGGKAGSTYHGKRRKKPAQAKPASAAASSLSLQTFLERTTNVPKFTSPASTAGASSTEQSKDERENEHNGAGLVMSHIVMHSLQRGATLVLQALRPKFVIVYDPDTTFIRQLEVYKAENPGAPLRVYFLMYENSVEEQRYLSSLRKEKEAFEMLIREKANMAVVAGQDGKEDTTQEDELREEIESFSQNRASTRKGGKQLPSMPKGRILIDNREFRSALPCTLHMRGFEVAPCHLQEGDYVLSQNLAVERKSPSDLLSSLKSGRLYNQAEAMSRRFADSALLIEFSQQMPFSLQAGQDLGTEINAACIGSKLALLCLHFPRLRVLWTRSPHATAELFELLKKQVASGEPELSAESDSSEGISNRLALAPKDVLLRLPGITDRNVNHVMANVENLQQLCQMTERQLVGLLGVPGGQNLYHFLSSTS